MNLHRMRLLALTALAGAFPASRPRDPEPTHEDIEALVNRCAAAGVDLLELGDRCRRDMAEFVRLAKAALAARDARHQPDEALLATTEGLRHLGSTPTSTASARTLR